MRQQEPGRRGSSPAAYHGGPPPALRCLACNGSFFAVSLPIHQKTCFQRNAFVDMACRKCQANVRSGLMQAHEASCSGPPAKDIQCLPSEDRPVQELNAPETDGRVRCKKCGRGFHQDRIAKHQSVCHASIAPEATANQAHSSKSDRCPPRTSCRSPVKIASRTAQTSSLTSLNHNTKVVRQVSHTPRLVDLRATASECRVQKITLDLGPSRPNQLEARSDRFDDRRFDPVHRDAAHHERFQTNPSSLNVSLQGRSALLSMSNMSSSANPLATNRFMTA